jgi:hypothetical protein
MYCKYEMLGQNDYRGNVALVVANGNGTNLAYTTTDMLDPDMIELVEEEVALVIRRTDVDWLSIRETYRKRLDKLSDDIRDSYKYPGQNTIDMEYGQVDLVLKEWQAAGSDPANVPDEIEVWQDVTGETLAWVVNDIETSIGSYRRMIRTIRRLRLMGKKVIGEAPSAEIDGVFNQYAAQLEAMRAVPEF